MPKSRPSIPDATAEFMQLSLFSEVPDSPPVDNLKEESSNASDGRPDTAARVNVFETPRSIIY
jgi:hypothetical protein